MVIANRKEAFILFVGDVVLLYLSLWLTLTFRALIDEAPVSLSLHLIPFTILIAVWLLIFFIAGLYEKHTLLFKSKLPKVILNTQIMNSVVAVLFFYFIPYFGITPKTNLFLYLMISFVLIIYWRLYGITLLGMGRKQRAVLLGRGKEMEELAVEVNHNSRYNLKFVLTVDLNEIEGVNFEHDVMRKIREEGISVVVIDIKNEKIDIVLPYLYTLLASHVRFIDKHEVYEDIFDRIPLSLIGYSWFLENLSLGMHSMYDFLKRAMDMVVALPLALVSLVVYPFVWLAIKLEDKGPIFIIQERVGQNNRPIHIIKFRSMTVSDRGKHVVENDPRITKVGKFLRKSRIDELPQLWNIVTGDMSLVGPRPELPDLVKLYNDEIPYYNVRHLIKPGLSGWAQIHHDKPPHSIEETRLKLSYDLYYIKNRSFMLDLEIALKTINTLLSRTGI